MSVVDTNYTQGSSRAQEKLVDFTAYGNCLNVSVNIPWECAIFAANFFPQLSQVLSDQSKIYKDSASRDFERRAEMNDYLADEMRFFQRTGRLCAHHLRQMLRDGYEENEAIQQVSFVFEKSEDWIKLAIRKHNKIVKSRATKIRDIRLIRWADEGKSNKEIAALLGLSTSYTAKLVRSAIDKTQGAANDN